MKAPNVAYRSSRRTTETKRADKTIRGFLATTPEAVEDAQAESTDANIGESTYLIERVRGAERNEERAKWSREDQTTSIEEINAEIWHTAVLNRGRARKVKKVGQKEQQYTRHLLRTVEESTAKTGLVDRMEPVVWMERMVMLEVEKHALRRRRAPDQGRGQTESQWLGADDDRHGRRVGHLTISSV